MTNFDKHYFRVRLAERELSMRQAAQRMGMGHSQLSLTFSGVRRMQLPEAVQLADMLGVSLQEVAEHAGAMQYSAPQAEQKDVQRHFEEMNWLQKRKTSAKVESKRNPAPPPIGEEMSNEIITQDSPAALPAVQPATLPAPTTPAQIVAYAMQHGAPIDQIREFMALQREWEADQARKAYVEAMAQFKLNPPTIDKDKQVSFGAGDRKTEYKHASIGNVTDKIVKALAQHGFSHAWDTQQQNGQVIVTCTITHRLGHKESVTLQAAPDNSGGKNGIQQIISAQTYLQRHTLLAATGLATQDQSDDDGKGYGLNTSLADKWIDALTKCKSEAEMKGVWPVAVAEIRAANDGFAYDEVKRAYGDHLALLKGSAQ